jgi:alpha-galactosidase
MLAAPLIAGNDMQSMSVETREILTNPEAIAVDQDAFGIQGFRYSANNGVEVWFKPLAGGDWALCILNRNKEAKKFSFDWKNEKVTDSIAQRDADFTTTAYRVRDLWMKREPGSTAQKLATEIPGHDALLFRLEK